MHYVCPECEQQAMTMSAAYWTAAGLEEWTFTCTNCDWEGTSNQGFWDQRGYWNKRSGSLNW